MSSVEPPSATRISTSSVGIVLPRIDDSARSNRGPEAFSVGRTKVKVGWDMRVGRLRAMASGPANEAPYRLIDDVDFGEGVVVYSFTNLYGCRIGDGTRIGTFVEIQRGA